MIKESLHNIVKHSCASEVSISFELTEGYGHVYTIMGKSLETTSPHRFGNGLKNMEQQMESIGDNFEIENQNGTTIKLYCPLDHLKTNRSAYNECSIKIEKCSSIFANETFLKSINAISHFSKNVEDMVYVRK